MSAGDILNSKRLRTQANERLDTVDTETLAQSPRLHQDAWSRAIEVKPRAAGGSSPVGTIFQGFGLTLNPVNPTDGKVRVQSAVGVAVDSNGRMLIKENGVTVDLTLASGNSQIYAYFIEDAGDTTVRRQISVSSPYVESGTAMATSQKGDVGYWVRAGDQTSIVSTDVVLGTTTALCFLGIANNAGGTITMTGYDVVNAPNGAYVTNRATSVVAPTTPPPANTANGSPATILDVITAALYGLGEAMWKGSTHLTPSAANNFGAYNIPAGGVDRAFRQALGYVTIGDGTTIFGDFNTADYSDNNAMLTAAIASLPTAGGRIYIKPGVSLVGFTGATIAMPAGKTVQIIGDHSSVPTNAPHLTFAAGEGIACSATGALVLQDLHISYAACSPILMQAGPIKVRNLYLSNTGTASSTTLSAFRDGAGCTAITNIDIDGLTWSTNFSAVQVFPALFVVSTSAIPTSNVRILNVTHNNAAHEVGLFIIFNVQNNVEIGGIRVNQSFATTGVGSSSSLMILASLDNTTNIQGRYVHDVTINNTAGTPPKLIVMTVTTCGYLRCARIDVNPASCTAVLTGAGVTGPLSFEDCIWDLAGFVFSITGLCGDVSFTRVRWLSGALFSIGDGTSTVARVRVANCFFSGNYSLDQGSQVYGTYVEQVIVSDCVFDSIFDAAAAAWSIITVSSNGSLGIVREARFLRNTVSNFQNVTYTGSDSTSTPVFFNVNSFQTDMAECSETTVRSIMSTTNGSAGNTRRAPFIFGVTNNLVSQGFYGTINFERNKSQWWGTGTGGGQPEACQGCTITNYFSIQKLVIDGNEFVTPYNVTTAPLTNDIFYLASLSASLTPTINYFRWTNNRTTINVGDANPVTMGISILEMQCSGTPTFGTIGQLCITGNSLNVGHTSGSFGGASTFDGFTRHGIDIIQNLVAVTIVRDNFGSLTTLHTTSDFWKLNLATTAQIYNVNGDGGTLPGSGVAYPNCVNFVQL
jgi:hypothetical protein